MPPTKISRRILGCLLLILSSQCGDAWNSRYMENIMTSLQHIENMFAEQNSLNCLVPAETLFSMVAQLAKMNNESTEANTRRFLFPWNPFGPDNLQMLRRTVGLDNDSQELKREKQRRKHNNRNENLNANINRNINTNQLRARRTLDESALNPSKLHNHNMNSNFNVNSNINRNKLDIFDYSEEEGETQ